MSSLASNRFWIDFAVFFVSERQSIVAVVSRDKTVLLTTFDGAVDNVTLKGLSHEIETG
jgi:hypothetical protein